MRVTYGEPGKVIAGLEYSSIDLAGRTLEGAFTSAEITGCRSVLGQLLWLIPRGVVN